MTQALLDAADLGPGLRALDVGCGSGTLLAAGVAAGAEMVGADISPTMVAAARRRVPEAVVLEADVQTTDLLSAAPGAPFERVISQFGVMFFADPVEAFSRMRAAASDDARMTFMCWRERSENRMFTLGNDVLVARMAPRPEQAADAPGPTVFADPERTRSTLEAAGWTGVQVEAFDFTCDYGIDGSDGVEERLSAILSTTTGQQARSELEPSLGADGWSALLDDVREEIASARVDGAVRFPGATWLVTARAGS